jgi:hypothetical protein
MTPDSLIVVPAAEFNELRAAVAEMRQTVASIKHDSSFRFKVYALADKGVIKSGAVAQIMGWSRATISRRITSGELPMTKDGSRYHMAVDEFIEWYNQHLMINTKQ